MSHVDDGQLNALLDGELSPAEAREVETHVASCAECARRLADARAFLTEAGELLSALDVPQAVQPAAPAAGTVVSEGLVAPVAPGPAPAILPKPGEPPHLAKTSKEVAVSIDGRTAITPAIRPVFPHEVPQAPKRRWQAPGLERLAWAASLILAVGVGYLANEVYHSREQQAAFARTDVAMEERSAEPSANVAAPPADGAPAEGSLDARQRAGAGAASARGTTGGRREPPKPRVSKPPPEFARPQPEQLAAAGADQDRRQVAGPAARGTTMAPQPAAAAPLGRARAETQQRPAPQPGSLSDVAGAGAPAAAPQAADEVARRDLPASPMPSRTNEGAAGERESNAVSFRRVPMEEAVRTLSGSIRLIDGMNPARVEIGPGRLVPGANPGRDVVRVVYADPRGGQLTLDQQLGDTGGAFNGLMTGDTLVASGDSGVQVRWIDRKFWMSLSGSGPADSLRALVERVR